MTAPKDNEYDVEKTYHLHKDLNIQKKREIEIKIPGFKIKKCNIKPFKGKNRKQIKCSDMRWG
jgi:hypothetical protein